MVGNFQDKLEDVLEKTVIILYHFKRTERESFEGNLGEQGYANL